MRNKLYRVVVTSCVLFAFILCANIALADIDAKSSAGAYTGKIVPRDLTTDNVLQEGFESWYPTGWDQIIYDADFTWHQTYDTYYDGFACAEIVYDTTLAPQDEWMISPALDFSSAGEVTLTFWFYTSYYWHVTPYDNGDMEIRISIDGGDNWTDPIWTENDYGTFTNFTWYEVSLSLDDLVGESNCKIALVYEGQDGAQACFDAVSVDFEPQLNHDIGLVEFVAPNPNGNPNVAVTPELLVRNYGTNDETFNINLVIELEGNEVYSENYRDAVLTIGEANSFIFNDFMPTQSAVYNFYAEVVLEGDEDAGNNTLSMTYNTMSIVYHDFDFEADDADFSGTNDWQYGTIAAGPEGGHSGTSGWGTQLNDEYTLGPLLSTLTTPEFQLGTNGILTFYHWYETESTFDGGNVKISTDGGSDWNIIVPEDGYDGSLSENWRNPIGGEDAFYGDQTSWTMETFDLSAYAEQNIMIKFDYGSDTSIVDGDGWYIDDFHLEYFGGNIGVDDGVELLPASFSLNQNYPNPFNAQTEISFSITNEADVELVIFNSLGQVVETLVSERMSAGSHSVSWDASNVSSGIYFYKLSAAGKTEVRALTLIK